MAHRDVVGADPPGAAAVERRDPDVVLGGEGDQLAVQMRVPEIPAEWRGCVTRSPYAAVGVRDRGFGSLALRSRAGHLPWATVGSILVTVTVGGAVTVTVGLGLSVGRRATADGVGVALQLPSTSTRNHSLPSTLAVRSPRTQVR